jgi:hypothetical protein
MPQQQTKQGAHAGAWAASCLIPFAIAALAVWITHSI